MSGGVRGDLGVDFRDCRAALPPPEQFFLLKVGGPSMRGEHTLSVSSAGSNSAAIFWSRERHSFLG